MAPSRIWQAIQRAAGTAGQAPPSARDMLRDLYGTGPRGGLDTRKAAAALGVSSRTVQRWAQTGLPATPAARSMRQRHSRWRNTHAGRRAAIGAAGERMRSNGAGVQLTGVVQISSDRRNRSTSFVLTGPQMDLLLDVAVRGTRADLQAAFEYVAGDSFGGSVQFPTIDQLDFL